MSLRAVTTRCVRHCQDRRCDRKSSSLWYCGVCKSTYCDGCWDFQSVHDRIPQAYDIPHERTSLDIAEMLYDAFEPPVEKDEREAVHRDDQNTAWFGIDRPDADDLPLQLQDYGRLLDLTNYWERQALSSSRDHRTPSLVSFVGETGAGKSSIVRLLIDCNTMQGQTASKPIVGPPSNILPTSEDVHLYLDPKTEKTPRPILFADCEGLNGGDSDPFTAQFKRKWDTEDEETARADGAFFKEQKVVCEYDLVWSTLAGSRSRGFAVGHLYPRLLYAFSDVIVFVLRNSRTLEKVFETLINWARKAIETSSNQPVLPHAIIVLNASDNDNRDEFWDSTWTTDNVFEELSQVLDRNEMFRTCASEREIETLKDLVLCYYSSIKIIRVPNKTRPKLVHQQLLQLYNTIDSARRAAQETRLVARKLLEVNHLHRYMQEAFGTFAEKLDASFDFSRASLRNSPFPLDFSGNISKLVLRVINNLKDNTAVGPAQILIEVSFMIASNIMLDSARSSSKGSPVEIFGDYIPHLDKILKTFCECWPCEYRDPKTGLRCVNVVKGHGKGHQDMRANILSRGKYQATPGFSFEEYCDVFRDRTYFILENLMLDLARYRNKRENFHVSEAQAAAKIHRDTILTTFFQRVDHPDKRGEGAGPLTSHTVCFCCFLKPAEHPLPCGHMLCEQCIFAYGEVDSNTATVTLHQCPIEGAEETWSQPHTIRVKPQSAGIRVMSLDGGGIRGIIELEVLRQIENALGGNLAIQSFFDLIVGTSTGGLAALGLGAKGWSVEQCIHHFEALCASAFTKHTGVDLWVVGKAFETFHHSRYETGVLERSLQRAFAEDLLFGGRRAPVSSQAAGRGVKVAVTAASMADKSTYVLSNYNWPEHKDDKLDDYRFQRPEDVVQELKIWEAARATCAAPQFFTKFHHIASRKSYIDGAVFHNNPIYIADAERRHLWPEAPYPDIMLSIGTGRSPPFTEPGRLRKATKGFVAHWRQLLNILVTNMQATMDSEKTWKRYSDNLVSGLSTEEREILRTKLVRIDPEIPGGVPEIDEIDKMAQLRTQVEEYLTEPRRRGGTQRQNANIERVARQLIASSFYFNPAPEPVKKGFGNWFQITGEILCRLSPDEIRHLGQHLQKRAESEGPLSIVVWHHGSERSVLEQIDLMNVLGDMIDHGIFAKECVFKTTTKDAPIQMRLHFGDTESHLISGFPRRITPTTPNRGRQGHRSHTQFREPTGSLPPRPKIDWVPPAPANDDAAGLDIRRYSDPQCSLEKLVPGGPELRAMWAKRKIGDIPQEVLTRIVATMERSEASWDMEDGKGEAV
ncbi:putative lysophospholipase-like protein [Triangularia verruculosa]|uniref:Lysophospholipase-like protein n=1 Tax=Triangularia verruculosa TaxID=2587418 RepID=A0AAN6XGE5_9PEZI|nr:putative lysophospholipase-like protein [Triangularia verruculosa]